MLEAMLLGKKNTFIPGEIPYIGYNFDKGVSTGQQVLTIASLTAADVVTPPAALAGYTKALWEGSKAFALTPMAAFDIGTGDFTLEFPFYCTQTANGYSIMFAVLNAAGVGIQVRFGDNGYGNRLQVSLQPSSGGYNFSTSGTRATLTNKWNYIVLQRRNGKLMVYLNGLKQGLASFTGSDYSNNEVASPQSLASTNQAQLGYPQYPGNAYVPEFAFYRKARYSANFTPKYPIVA